MQISASATPTFGGRVVSVNSSGSQPEGHRFKSYPNLLNSFNGLAPPHVAGFFM